MVQGKEKRKKVNKVRRLTKCGHNKLSGMQANGIDELCNPEQEYTLVDPTPLLHSVHHFINNLVA